jgi:hypothetical protein
MSILPMHNQHWVDDLSVVNFWVKHPILLFFKGGDKCNLSIHLGQKKFHTANSKYGGFTAKSRTVMIMVAWEVMLNLHRQPSLMQRFFCIMLLARVQQTREAIALCFGN